MTSDSPGITSEEELEAVRQGLGVCKLFLVLIRQQIIDLTATLDQLQAALDAGRQEQA